MKHIKFAKKFYNLKCKVKYRWTKKIDPENLAEVHNLGTHYLILLNKRHKIPRVVIWHEMTHIKQFEQDGLYMSDELMMFKGERVTHDEYWLYPWEIEARGMELALDHYWKGKKWHIPRKKKKS